MRICIYKWVYAYNPKATHICKYNIEYQDLRLFHVTHARPQTRAHTHTHKSTRVHMNAYIHMHNHTNTVVWVCVCVRESVYVRECVC